MTAKMTTTKMIIAAAGMMLSLAAAAASAKTEPAKKMAAATTYECTKCHMKVSAAIAKKDHYKDAMDGGTLVPVKAVKK